MKLIMLILFNGFLFSITPSSVHNSTTTNESPIVNDHKSKIPAPILDPHKIEKITPNQEDDKCKVPKPDPCSSPQSIG